jgi:hypothetical protein
MLLGTKNFRKQERDIKPKIRNSGDRRGAMAL